MSKSATKLSILNNRIATQLIPDNPANRLILEGLGLRQQPSNQYTTSTAIRVHPRFNSYLIVSPSSKLPIHTDMEFYFQELVSIMQEIREIIKNTNNKS